MHTILFFILGFGYIGLLIWGIFLAKRVGPFHLSKVLLLVIFALAYDNLIIAIGKFLGEGILLKSLSYIRFYLHTLFTPTLILFAWSVFRDSKPQEAMLKVWTVLAYLLTVGLVLYEFLMTTRNLKLAANWQNGLLTYENVDQAMDQIMVIVVTVTLAIVGYILLRQMHFPYLLFGTIIMIIGGVISMRLNSISLINVFEFLLMISLVITKKWQIQIVNFKERHS